MNLAFRPNEYDDSIKPRDICVAVYPVQKSTGRHMCYSYRLSFPGAGLNTFQRPRQWWIQRGGWQKTFYGDLWAWPRAARGHAHKSP